MNETAKVVADFGREARSLKEETDEYMEAKRRKSLAENAVLSAIVEAVHGALPSVCSKINGQRAIEMGRQLYLGEKGDFFEFKGVTVQVLDLGQVLDRTSLSAILAILITAVRAQTGTIDKRTTEVEKEAAVLEGIALAFKVGGVR